MTPEYPGMDLATARSLMAAPVFGSTDCIKARQILVMVDDLKLPKGNGVDTIEVTCDECDGTGECMCGNGCNRCGANGTIKRRVEVGKMQEMEIFSMWEIWKRKGGIE